MDKEEFVSLVIIASLIIPQNATPKSLFSIPYASTALLLLHPTWSNEGS